MSFLGFRKSKRDLELERISRELEALKAKTAKVITREDVVGLVQKTTIAQAPQIFSKLEERVLKPPPVSKMVTLYQVDGIAFILTEVFVNQILSGTFTISGQNPAIVQKFKEWWDRIEIEDMLEYPVRDAILGGWGFLELARNKGQSSIVKLVYVNPEGMDWQRDSDDEVKLDDDGYPVGWEQEKVTTKTEEGKARAPVGEEGKFPRDKIFALKFWGLDPYSTQTPLQSSYKDEVIFLNIRESLGEGVFRHGYPLAIAEIGDEGHDPTPEVIRQVDEDLKNIGSLSELTVPFWYKIRFEKPGDMSPIARIIDLYGDIVLGSWGTPKGVIMGSPGGRYGGALNIQVEVWEGMIQRLQKKLCTAIRNQMFKPLAKLDDFKIDGKEISLPDIPHVQIVTPIPAQKMSKARRMSMYGRAGLMTWDADLEEKLRVEEGLPVSQKGKWEQMRKTESISPVEEPLSPATNLQTEKKR